jgi:chromosome segregation ATPase
MGMSGIELPEPIQATSPDTPPESAAHVARGKELAAALADVLQTRDQQAADVRTALADAERAKQELFELKGHVYGLERTLGFRNRAMKTRENRIRELRTQLQKLTVDHDRIRGSRTYAVSRVIFHAAQIRRPHVVARKLSRRLRRR